MSKTNSGLFSGTKGSSNGTSDETNKTVFVPYVCTKALKDHIEKPDTSSTGSDGIKGAHHKDNFLKEIDNVGAQIIDSTPNSQIDGVEQITYKMPKKDKQGKPTGDFKAKTYKKTVYDPSKISTDTYIKWGLEAANNTAKLSPSKKLGHEWTGTDNQGFKWHGYCNDNGEITSFYPDN